MRSAFIFPILVALLLTLVATADVFAGETPCLNCHVEFTKTAASSHPFLTSDCGTCHIPVKGRNHPDQKGSIELLQDIPGLCYGCHDQSAFRNKSLHPTIIINTCTACHNPHQSAFKKLLVKEVPELCYECHKKFRGKAVHAPVGKGLCMSCHRPHASKYSEMLISPTPDLCYTCHDRTPFTKKHVHVPAAVPNGCMTCHRAHAGENPLLLSSKSVPELCARCHHDDDE